MPSSSVRPRAGEHGEPAVRRVDVEPDAALDADGSERAQAVDGPGVRRAAARRDEERPAAGACVGVDRGRERARLETLIGSDREHAHLLGLEAEDARRARE